MLELASETGDNQKSRLNETAGLMNSKAPAQQVVYVVDDEPLVVELLVTFLRMKGFQTRQFVNPKLALRELAQGNSPPDLLITDFVMEGLNGMELIGHCLKMNPNMKTMLISGNVGEEILLNYDFKPNYFLRKPFLSSQLIDIVESLLT